MARRLLWALLVVFVFCTPARAHDPGMTLATIILEEHETLIELSVKRISLDRAIRIEERLVGAACSCRVSPCP